MGVLARKLASSVLILGPDDCWPWVGWVDPATGYGQIKAGIIPVCGAHMAAYVVALGPIPAQRVIDHTCHNTDESCAGGATCLHRRCCNPRHLRAVTHAENIAAGRAVAARRAARDARTVCANEHPLDEVNRIVDRRGNVSCRQCKREWARRKVGAKPTGPLRPVVARQGRWDTLDCGHTLRRSSARTSARRACSECERVYAA